MVDWGLIEVDKLDVIVKFDADVVKVEEGVGSGKVVKGDICYIVVGTTGST